MTRTFVSAAALGFVVALAATPAQAQTSRPWSVSFDLGAQMAVTGDSHNAGTGTVLKLPTSVSAKSYGDVFGHGFYWAAGVGYAVTPKGEIRVSGSYTKNPSTSLQVGTVANLPLLAKFDDYKAFGMDFGYRQHLMTGMIAPYVGATVGFARIDAINSTLTVPAANVTLPNVGFYASSTVPTFAGEAGAQVHLSDAVSLQAGVQLRWQNNLKQNEGLAGTGLETLNNESRRWTAPVTAGLTVRF